MSEELIHIGFLQFIDIAKDVNIDFAKITYSCGAHQFVDEEVDFGENDEFIRTYSFNEFYTDWRFAEYMPFYVLAILNKAYVMYELKDEITVWVCYTEEKHRGEGHMTRLLKKLSESHPALTITVDTYSQTLRNICTTLNIRLFL